MRFDDLTDAEADYIFRLLLARPMGEVEPLVMKLRRQVMAQAAGGMPANAPEGAATRPNGAGPMDDGLPLP